MECKLIGAEIISVRGEKGLILDKVNESSNGASTTSYLCMRNDGTTFSVYHYNIKQILSYFKSKEYESPNYGFYCYLQEYKHSK